MQSNLRATFSNIFVSAALVLVFYLGFALALALGYWAFIILAANSANETLVRTAPVLGPYLGGGLTLYYTFRIIRLFKGKIDFGLPLHETQCDELDYLILDVANDLDVPGPDEIFLSYGPEAFAYEVTLTSDVKRVLCIGWPLVRVLTGAELKSVIAHELAHFDNRAFFVHHSIWRLTQSIGKVKAILSNELSNTVYLAVAGYLRVIQPLYDGITRNLHYEFEFYCDKQGAERFGSNIFSGALTKVVKLQICFNDYLERFPNDPANSFFDDFLNYYLQLMSAPELDEVMARVSDENTPSHPSLNSRIQAVKDIPLQLDVTNPIIQDDDKIRGIQLAVASFYATAIRSARNDKRN
ncbi:MAG: M48 family metalloprotease [Chloroflexi bacterium]|nr:M48 family metalloprotease [Chloroflexota bacterium]